MSKGKKEQYDSPRLKQLVEEIEAGKEDALECFWREVKAAGIPLIEPRILSKKNAEGIEENLEDDEHDWVSFLYEGDAETKSVSLRAGFMFERGLAPENLNFLIKHIENTNVWYWTEKLTKDIRLDYWLCANDPLLSPEALENKEVAREYTKKVLKVDPANPKAMLYHADPDDPDDFDIPFSIIEGKLAAPQPHIAERPDVPKGSLSSFQFESKILGNSRKNWVYTPPDFDAKRAEPYPFLLVFDGRVYFDVIPGPVILDNLLAEGKIPPTVYLMFSNIKDQRGIELPPNEKMPEALAKELIPYMREAYNISHDPAQITIGGSSLGGLAAAWNAFKNPQIFGNVLSQSGAFWWQRSFAFPETKDPDELEHGWLIRQFAKAEKLPLKFYMDVGRLEKSNSWGEGFSHRGMNRHMRDVLRAKAYPVHYVEYAGGHNYAWWRQTLADGLIALHEMAKGA